MDRTRIEINKKKRINFGRKGTHTLTRKLNPNTLVNQRRFILSQNNLAFHVVNSIQKQVKEKTYGAIGIEEFILPERTEETPQTNTLVEPIYITTTHMKPVFQKHLTKKIKN